MSIECTSVHDMSTISDIHARLVGPLVPPSLSTQNAFTRCQGLLIELSHVLLGYLDTDSRARVSIGTGNRAHCVYSADHLSNGRWFLIQQSVLVLHSILELHKKVKIRTVSAFLCFFQNTLKIYFIWIHGLLLISKTSTRYS